MISIIHPSRGRAKQAADTANKWISRADCKSNIEYLMSLDEDDYTNYFDLGLFSINNMHRVLYPNKSAIEAINVAAKQATGNILIVVSDDFDCPQGWDTSLKDALKDKSDYLVKTRDGIQKTLITLPIMDRAYYNRFGYVYYPGFRHMFSDQEMTAVGHMLGRVIELPLDFPHNHYTVGKSPKDAINIRNDASWGQGAALFSERLRTNFGIENPVMKYEEIIWK